MASGDNIPNEAVRGLSPFDTFEDFHRSLGQTILLKPKVPSSFKKLTPVDFIEWSRRLRQQNQSRDISMEECISTLYEILKDRLGEESAKKILEKIRTPSVWRYWSGVAVVLAGYVSRFWPLKSDSLLLIQRKNNISTNNALESHSGLIIRMPFYADIPLREFKYCDFIDAVCYLNPGRRKFANSRHRTYWVFHAVITLEYHFESESDQIAVLEKANSSEAEEYWEDYLGSQASYMHPSKDSQRIGSSTGRSAYLIPHCVHHSVGDNVFVTYIVFVPAFLAVNRLRLLSEDCARYAYKSVLEDRVKHGHSSKAWKETYLKTMDTVEADHLWSAIRLGREFAAGHGYEIDRYKPGIPSNFQISVQKGFRVPLAQPSWLKDEVPVISFMSTMHYINTRDGRQLSLKEIKAHWRYQKWEQHANYAREMAEQDSLREAYDSLCRASNEGVSAVINEGRGVEVKEEDNDDPSVPIRQPRIELRPRNSRRTSTRIHAPPSAPPATSVTRTEQQRQLLHFEQTNSMLRQLTATILDEGCAGLDAAALRACWEEMDSQLVEARHALLSSMEGEE
ncbi:MAG: hypothetical protein M1835_001948 [Candelina submexicana]|nr:MAG: hypothetical protein M1835_001948 [Candelina submexicana]